MNIKVDRHKKLYELLLEIKKTPSKKSISTLTRDYKLHHVTRVLRDDCILIYKFESDGRYTYVNETFDITLDSCLNLISKMRLLENTRSNRLNIIPYRKTLPSKINDRIKFLLKTKTEIYWSTKIFVYNYRNTHIQAPLDKVDINKLNDDGVLSYYEQLILNVNSDERL